MSPSVSSLQFIYIKMDAGLRETDKESWAVMWDTEQKAVCGRRLLPHTGQDEWWIKAGLQWSHGQR